MEGRSFLSKYRFAIYGLLVLLAGASLVLLVWFALPIPGYEIPVKMDTTARTHLATW